MRICYFTPVFLPDVGGAEVVTDALAQQFNAQGHETVVLAQGSPQRLDVTYPVEWFAKPLVPRWIPERVGRSLAKLHAGKPFDLFCCNYAQPTGYAAVKLAERTGTPVVIISHGGDIYQSSKHRKNPHLWKRTQHAYRHADGLIAISPYIAELISEIQPNPPALELIPNGVDIAALNEPAPQPRDFVDPRPFALCLGNLNEMKGFADAIAAYAKQQDQLDDLILVIVGKGALEEPLRKQARESGVAQNILFLGQRTGADKRWLMQNCRFGLMPSLEEGHPIVGLEFLAVSKPVVCSTNAAFDGMFDEGINSFRTPAQDPAALGEALVKMHYADCDKMGGISRDRAGQYDWSHAAGQYLHFFERVIAMKGAGGRHAEAS